LLIYQVAGKDRNLLEVSEAEAVSIEEQSKLAAPEALTRIMEVLSDGESRLRDASSKKILIEITLLKAIQARQAVSIDSVLTKLRDLQNNGGSNSGSSTVASTTPKPVTRPAAPVLQTASAAPPLPEGEGRGEGVSPVVALPQNADLPTLWREVIEAAGRASGFAREYLIKTHPVSLTKTTFTLGLAPIFAEEFGLLDTPKNRTLVETKLAEMGHRNISVRFIQSESPAGWAQVTPEAPEVPKPKPAAAAAPVATAKSAKPLEPAKAAPVQLNKDEFKNDPLIKKALEIFKGQIVEVRA
jgi:DNA polymerase-3 subunit gamma/tau